MFRVLHHNNCFDGACSAAVFTKLHRECLGGADGYEYRGLQHGRPAEIPESVFGPGENAIVDFKYTASPKLTWWFDHHQSAFLTESDRLHYEAVRGEGRQFFDAAAVSCTGLIARVGRERFGFETARLEDLLHWADIIDGARFESAASAVEMRAPAMKLAMVIENAPPVAPGHEDGGLIARVIPLLTAMPLGEVLAQPFVAEQVAPLWERHVQAMELVRERARVEDGVVFFDLTDQDVEGLSKFIPYSYYPEAVYTVALTRSSFRVKISVGTNPWTTVPEAKLVNLAAICERFGGGGHARVGAISFGRDEVERGRRVAGEIVTELRTGCR